MGNNYSNELANVVKQFFDAGNWHFTFDEDTGTFRSNTKIDGKLQKISYVIRIRENQIISYGICPIGADSTDANMMAQMAEFICRANYGLRNGCFEMDFDDGEIRYKSFIDCDNLIPSTDVIVDSMLVIPMMFERYGSGITNIIFAGFGAKEAIDLCEN